MIKVSVFLVLISLVLCVFSCCTVQKYDSSSNVFSAEIIETNSVGESSCDCESVSDDNDYSFAENDTNEHQTVPEGATSDIIKKCNRSSGGYATFTGTHWFYYCSGDINGLYMCDTEGNDVVCIDKFENTQRPMLESVGDTVFYVRTTLLETPIEIGEYVVPFYKELCLYSNGNIKVLTSENLVDYEINGDHIYYTACDSKIYKMKLDGTERESITQLAYPMNLQIVQNKVFSHMNEALYEIDANGDISNGYNLLHYSLAMNGKGIYYISLSDMSLRYTEDNGITYSKLADSVINFCVYKDKLIYESMNDIYISDLDGNGPRKLCIGSSPMVVNGRLLCIVDEEIVSVEME